MRALFSQYMHALSFFLVLLPTYTLHYLSFNIHDYINFWVVYPMIRNHDDLTSKNAPGGKKGYHVKSSFWEHLAN